MLPNYDIARPLGKGTFGEVFLAHRRDCPEKSLAVKKIRDMVEDGYFDVVGIRETEFYNVLQKYKIPGVVHMEEAIIHPDPQSGFSSYIAMDACMGGSLDALLLSDDYLKVSLKERLTSWVGYVATFRDMHKLGISHLDIKTENILCKTQSDLISSVICDGSNAIFSIPNLKYNLPNIPFISPVYRPPEFTSYTDMTHPDKADVWSLGILFLEMFGGGEFIDQLNYDSDSIASAVQPELKKYRNILNGRNHKSISSMHIAKDLHKEKDELNDRVWNIHYVANMLNRLKTENLWEKYMSKDPIFQNEDDRLVTVIKDLTNFVQKYMLTGSSVTRISSHQLYEVLETNLKGRIVFAWRKAPIPKYTHIAKNANLDTFWVRDKFLENMTNASKNVKFYRGGVKQDMTPEFLYYVKALCDFYLSKVTDNQLTCKELFGACLLLAGEVNCFDIRRKELISLGLLPETNYNEDEFILKRTMSEVYRVLQGNLIHIVSGNMFK